MPYTVAAVDRALAILELLAEEPGLGVSDIARRLDTTKSRAFRLLATLEQRGFVRKDPATQRYALGYQALYLGERGRQQTDLVTVAQPFLDELATRCRENVHLVVREGAHSICIALRESPQPLRLYAQVGRRGPLHAGGASKVLLAHAPAEVREEVLAGPLEVFTPATITRADELAALLAEIRRRPTYESSDDLDEGAFAIAAPIRDHQGAVIAALSIAGPSQRLDADSRRRHHQLVADYAERISRALGAGEMRSVEALAG